MMMGIHPPNQKKEKTALSLFQKTAAAREKNARAERRTKNRKAAPKNPPPIYFLATALAAATTLARVMPNFSYSTFAGAEAPNESMPTNLPWKPR